MHKPKLMPELVSYLKKDYESRTEKLRDHLVDGKQIAKVGFANYFPRFSPDGKKIAFVTGRQIWTMDSDGDDKDQVTRISTGAAAPVWSPDGKWIAFTSDVHPDCNNDDGNKRGMNRETSKVKAHIPLDFFDIGMNGAM
jgi:tricorn protease-like protein